jgi:hypothetical protein
MLQGSTMNMNTTDWRSAFLATSVLAGEALDDALAALGDASALGLSQLVGELRASSREVRARAIARVMTAVASDVDAARLA